jgi:hypothetical protein
VRALSCCDGVSQVLRELSLEVEGILDCRRLDVGVQTVDLGQGEPALGECAESLRLKASVDDMGGAAELARDDS